jgi:DNA-binding NarL/FixJ family response regulator
MDIADRDLAQDSLVSQPQALPAFEASPAPTLLPLSRIWAVIRSGAALVTGIEQTRDRLYVTLERRRPRAASSRIVDRRLDVLERLLLGESAKVIAYDLDVSMSTIATDRIMGCRSLGLDAKAARKPMFLVMAVHAAFGLIDPLAQVHEATPEQTTLSIERPDPHVATRLTTTEFEVLIDIVEGFSHAEIAERRGKSIRTIANQMASIFHKLQVSGKGSLLAKVARESRTSGRQSVAVDFECTSLARPMACLRGGDLAGNVVWMNQSLATALGEGTRVIRVVRV